MHPFFVGAYTSKIHSTDDLVNLAQGGPPCCARSTLMLRNMGVEVADGQENCSFTTQITSQDLGILL
ncbi:hypothetical protein N6H18_00030 [Reichenbachiella agarivorans]|uniref:Uncharacterized protein n=1 Tax=Reichenbachiella agarivorans TaxID=2979464 RepID=A0ABY6CPC3_9BACT|nr:hypothetical protein [Reichenbachiella agarivorans]UXP32362.1 hypothetical protein N6H18_00030 [Reichenbachiella agarivorans]